MHYNWEGEQGRVMVGGAICEGGWWCGKRLMKQLALLNNLTRSYYIEALLNTGRSVTSGDGIIAS